MIINDKTMKDFGDTIMGICNILGLLRTLEDAAYNTPDESPRMALMANALEVTADMLEIYYTKLDDIECRIRRGSA